MQAVKLSKTVGNSLKRTKKTVAVAESCSGGLLSHWITETPGSSGYFIGGVVAYSDLIKIKMLGVNAAVLKKFGAVSEPVAKAMALGIRRRMGAGLGIGITGIAGPDGGTKNKPVGLVYIAVSDKKKTVCRKFRFLGSRQKTKSLAAFQALRFLR